MYLFLDSSLYIQVGLLSEDLTWTHHELIQNKKGSQVLHSIIHSALMKAEIKLDDLKGIFLANGPGSYTGIRVAEGVAQVLEMEGLPVFSFYHFEVPQLCGISNYEFVSEAFKGEIFCYQVKDDQESSFLIKEDEFQKKFDKDKKPYHLNGEILGLSVNKLYDLYGPHSTDIFSKVLERGKHLPPYYYRAEEKEFNLPKGR